ncbi:MAG: helix-turn-helix transcriptional regulator [Pseudomonadota bacterium]
MNNGERPSLGSFEQLVLTSILRLGEGAYGVTIHAEIEGLAGRPIKLGAAYSTLDRVEDKGLVRSWLADPTQKRGGRSKRYYRLTVAGENALKESAATSRRILRVVDHSWG